MRQSPRRSPSGISCTAQTPCLVEAPAISPDGGASVTSPGAATAPASSSSSTSALVETGLATTPHADSAVPATPLVPAPHHFTRWNTGLLVGRDVIDDKFEARFTSTFTCNRIFWGRQLLTVFEPNGRPGAGAARENVDHEPTVEVAIGGDEEEVRIFLCSTSPIVRIPMRRGMKAEHLSLLRAHCGDEGAHFLALQVTSTDLPWVRKLMEPAKNNEPPLYSPDDIDNDEGRKYIICEVQSKNNAQFRTTLELLLRNPRIASIYREIQKGETAAYFRSQSSSQQEEIASLVKLKAEIEIQQQQRARFDSQVKAVIKLRDAQERQRAEMNRNRAEFELEAEAVRVSNTNKRPRVTFQCPTQRHAATQTDDSEFAVSIGTQTTAHLPNGGLDLQEENSRLKALVNSLMLTMRQPQMMNQPVPPPVPMSHPAIALPPPPLPPLPSLHPYSASLAPAPPPVPLPNLKREHIDGLKRERLRGYLREVGESTFGNPSELKARLTRYFDALGIETYIAGSG